MNNVDKIKKDLEKLKKHLEDMTSDNDKMFEKINESLEKASKEDVEIHLTKRNDKGYTCNITGSTLGLLLALAGLENSILRQTGAPREIYEFIKSSIETVSEEVK